VIAQHRGDRRGHAVQAPEAQRVLLRAGDLAVVTDACQVRLPVRRRDPVHGSQAEAGRRVLRKVLAEALQIG